MDIVKETINKLINLKLSLSVCESATGGMLGSLISEVAGVSSIFKGGIISYQNETKINVVNVKKTTIDEYGVISKQTAHEMCLNTNNLLKSDICISITGNAGPSTLDDKEVGLYYIGIAIKDFVVVREFISKSKLRQLSRTEAAIEAIVFLRELILKD